MQLASKSWRRVQTGKNFEWKVTLKSSSMLNHFFDCLEFRYLSSFRTCKAEAAFFLKGFSKTEFRKGWHQGSALLMFGPKMAKITFSWCYYNVTNGSSYAWKQLFWKSFSWVFKRGLILFKALYLMLSIVNAKHP